MRYFRIIVSLVLLGTTLWAGVKRYDIKSGIVEYSIGGGGTMMGIKSTLEGHSKVIFKSYGNEELHDETTTTTTMGRTTKSRNLTKFVGGTIYTVDFDDKRIIKMTPEYLKGKKDLQQFGKEMMQKMGGKVVGKGSVLGYPCEIWESKAGKVWLYKGVPLKIETTMMGFKHTQIATKAKFNVSIPESAFKLPDYPIRTMDQMIREEMRESGMPEDTPPPQMPKIDQEQLEQMMKSLGEMFGGGK